MAHHKILVVICIDGSLPETEADDALSEALRPLLVEHDAWLLDWRYIEGEENVAPDPQARDPHRKSLIEILIDGDLTEDQAQDALSEALRPLMREDDSESSLIGWRYVGGEGEDEEETSETVREAWGMVCPACGRDHALDIAATVFVRLFPNGTDPDAAAPRDHEWADDSAASCEACHWSGTVLEAEAAARKAGNAAACKAGNAAAYGLEIGQTHQAREGGRSPERKILWISADGEQIQYDGPAVALGHHRPIVSADAFAEWAGLAAAPAPEEPPHEPL